MPYHANQKKNKDMLEGTYMLIYMFNWEALLFGANVIRGPDLA